MFNRISRESFVSVKNYVNQSQATDTTKSKIRSKQIRSKRGQYKKYELSQLNKAVDAVMAGEISAHKASFCFGVPHSTLEYKVKERVNSNQSSKSCDLFNNKSLFDFGLNKYWNNPGFLDFMIKK